MCRLQGTNFSSSFFFCGLGLNPQVPVKRERGVGGRREEEKEKEKERRKERSEKKEGEARGEERNGESEEGGRRRGGGELMYLCCCNINLVTNTESCTYPLPSQDSLVHFCVHQWIQRE